MSRFTRRFMIATLLALLVTAPVSAQVIPVEIWEIQGAGHRSPLLGMDILTQNNIVTAVAGNGFYIQTPQHLFPNRDDGNDATSNGILVFTNSAPGVEPGDMVTVRGQVAEYRAGDASDKNLSITEITNPVVTLVAKGNTLPPPVLIGSGGRVPPGTVINDDSGGNAEDSGTFDHDADGLDFYESLEGMRVSINDAIVTGPTNNFGETWVVGDAGASASWLTARGGIVLTPGDFNPERVQLDDDLYDGDWPELDVGARFTTALTGVIGYSFQNYELLVTDPFTVEPGSLEREVTTLVGSADQLTVATYNVENLGGQAGNSTFDARADQIVNHLLAPDILVLQEIQDNDGSRNAAVVDATTTLTKLADAIERAGGPVYAFAQINPVNNQDGGAPGSNIRVAFLYNVARVTLAPQSTAPDDPSTTPVTFQCDQGVVTPSLNPGRIDPANVAFERSRKPLVGMFEFNGESLFVIGMHLNSKGGDDPLFGHAQPPTFASEQQRHLQAAAIQTAVEQILACDAEANVLVLGDVNDFWFSETLTILTGDRLHNLNALLLPAEERYSYIYQGNSQILDQILVSDGLLSVAEVDIVHINAEYVDQVTDHDPSVARFQFE